LREFGKVYKIRCCPEEMGDLRAGEQYEFGSEDRAPHLHGIFLGKQTTGRSSRPNRVAYRDGNNMVKAYSFAEYSLQGNQVFGATLHSVKLSDTEREYCEGLLGRAGL
jgi:hypothetical protein